MRVVFLDIDGVLNSATWFREHGESVLDDAGHLDPAACVRVQRLCEVTGAEIVISSTWRLLYPLAGLRTVLASRGLTAQILGVTPDLSADRGEEIQRWLDNVRSVPRTSACRPLTVEGIVILDDDADMLHLLPWLVKTRFEAGLTEADVCRAQVVLAESPPS